MAELPTRACWQSEDARAILRNEATEGQEHLFLATHSPIRDFDVEGSGAADLHSPDERGLLTALSAQERRHAFCVVEGEPGSGKSHLIRWLRVQWPSDEDKVLLVQRLDGSLEGTLRQLEVALPEHAELFENFASRGRTLTLTGQVREFYSNLVLALDPENLSNPPDDAEWCVRHDLNRLLAPPEIVDKWSAPRRVVELLSGKKGEGERDQELARFNVKDIATLSQVLQGLKVKTGPRGVRFQRELSKEATTIHDLPDEELEDPTKQETLRQQFRQAFALCDALNARRNHAVQNVLGISTEGLRQLFERLRQALRPRRLVLLLEDITAWEGIDNQLIDVLVTNVDTREEQDLCPMVSVVGLTPAYFGERGFQANYRQRITHHIRLGSESGQFQDVSSLRTETAQIEFAARYLRAVRAGSERLSDWAGPPLPVPNACDSCPHREPCHIAFGAHEGVGLYPFNESAIVSLYKCLSDPAHRSTLQTPRGMLQGALGPTLLRPDALEASEYPGRALLSTWVPPDEADVDRFAAQVIAARVEDEQTQQRIRRLIAFWGSDRAKDLETTEDQQGELLFARIRRDVYEAFGLPWIGGEVALGSGPEPSVVAPGTSPDGMPPDPSPEPGDDELGQPGSPTPGPAPGGLGTSPPPSPDPRPKPVIKSTEVVELLKALSDWTGGKNPRGASRLNEAAYGLLENLNWRRAGVSRWVRTLLFTSNTVVLDGTVRRGGTSYFLLPREEWVADGLRAYLNLRLGPEALAPAEEYSYQRLLARTCRRLEGPVRAYVDQRLPRREDGGEWNLAATAAQVLMARTWLRGTTSPVDEGAQQWETTIRDEGDPTSNPQDRVESWREAVEGTGHSHRKHRENLRRLLNLPQGDDDRQSVLDAGTAAAALCALRKAFRPTEHPAEVGRLGEQLADLTLLHRDAMATAQRLPRIPANEAKRLQRMATELDARLRTSSVREHLNRVNTVVEGVSSEIPSAAPAAVARWGIVFSKLQKEGFLDESHPAPSSAIESFLDRVADGAIPPVEDPRATLDWALRAPVTGLVTLDQATQEAEQTVTDILRYVQSFLASDAGGGDLQSVQEVGARLETTATAALDALQSGSSND